MSDENVVLEHFPPIKGLMEVHKRTHFVAEVTPMKKWVEFHIGRRLRPGSEGLAGLRIIYSK